MATFTGGNSGEHSPLLIRQKRDGRHTTTIPPQARSTIENLQRRNRSRRSTGPGGVADAELVRSVVGVVQLLQHLDFEHVVDAPPGSVDGAGFGGDQVDALRSKAPQAPNLPREPNMTPPPSERESDNSA